MSQILFIDDERTPPHQEEVEIARTSEQALQMIRSNSYSELWLDHDLGGEDTIMPVVDMLAEKAFNDEPYPADIVVHTANPVGRETIVRVLRRWGYNVKVLPATSWEQ